MSHECYSQLICNQCLTEEFEHTTNHKEKIIPAKAILEKIFLEKLDDYVTRDFKMVEVSKFYELFWKGIKLFYK
mgnify:CR=1 FL=1